MVLALLQSVEEELLRADLGGVNEICRSLPDRLEPGKGSLAVDAVMKAAFKFDLKRAQVKEIEGRLAAEAAAGGDCR